MPSFIGFVPTPPECIEGFFELATVSPSDVVYDLGAGDGRLLFAALERGASKAVGIDLDAELVHNATEAAKSKGLQDKVTFVESDVLDVSLAEATLVLCYLFPSASEALRPKFEAELNPGTRVVMESFHVPGWKESKNLSKAGHEFYLYVMPPETTTDLY